MEVDRLMKGQKVRGTNVDEWAEQTGLNWEVESHQVKYGEDNKLLGNRFVLVRSDTRHPLGLVSADYHVVQPRDILEFFKGIIDGFGGFEITNAGAMRGGQKVWARAILPDGTHAVGGHERADFVERELFLCTSYDLTKRTTAQQSVLRHSCTNRMIFKVLGEAKMEFSHRSVFNRESALQRMALDEQWSDMMETLDTLAHRKMLENELKDYFRELFFPSRTRHLPTYNPESADRKVAKMLEVYERAPGQAEAKGTRWGGLNAVTFYVDHEMKSRAGEDVLQDRIIFGDGAELKRRALELALALPA